MAKKPSIVFGNKERKQFPDPEGLEREKPSSAIEGSTQPTGHETDRMRSKFSESAPPKPGARETLTQRLARVGKVRGGVSIAAPRKEEREEMENKTFRDFVTEAKRGRPRKLRPGEEADTEHLQAQLNKLTHPNHVTVHFKDGSKHDIPREHANKALHHLASLKPIHREEHAEHMSKSHGNFYHVLSHKSIPEKKPKITLAGPKLRKEEVEQVDEVLDDVSKMMKYVVAHNASHKKANDEGDTNTQKKRERGAKLVTNLRDRKLAKMREEVEHDDDGWYTHREIHGDKGVSREDWKKGVRMTRDGKRVQTKKEEVEQISEISKKLFINYKIKAKKETDALDKKLKKNPDDQKSWDKLDRRMRGSNLAYKKFMGRGVSPTGKDAAYTTASTIMRKKVKEEVEQVDEIKAISGPHAGKAHKAPSITPSKVGYAGKPTKPKAQKLTREDYAPLKPGKEQPHPDEKVVDAKSRKQGAERPTKPKNLVKYTSEEIEFYNGLSDEHKAIFEKMDREQLNKMMANYKGKITKGEYNQPRESEKPWPASKMKGSKWASTAGSVNRKNQGYKK